MKKSTFLTAVSVLAFGAAGLSGCAAPAQVDVQVPEVMKVQNVENSQDGKITMNSSETVKVVPDMAEVVFAVMTENAEAAACQQENAEKLSALLDYLKGQGIEENSITTSDFSLDTRYDWSGNTQKLVGYSMRTQVTVTNVAIDSVGSLISNGVGSGANAVESVSYFSSKYDEAYAEALEKAVDLATSKAEALAAASGKKLGSVTGIQEYADNQYGRYVNSNYRMQKEAIVEETAAAAMDMGVMPGEMEVRASITVDFELLDE